MRKAKTVIVTLEIVTTQTIGEIKTQIKSCCTGRLNLDVRQIHAQVAQAGGLMVTVAPVEAKK